LAAIYRSKDTIRQSCFPKCFQEEIPQIQHSELTDLTPVGQGGYGVVYKAKHGRFGTVVYKELNAQKLGERYLKAVL